MGVERRREYIQSNKIMRPMHCLMFFATAPWIATAGLWLYQPAPPLDGWHDDSAFPAIVQAGDAFVVNRNFISKKQIVVHFTREMIKGDCRVACQRIPLPSGTLSLEQQEYKNSALHYIVPTTATPGKWRLVFSYQWEDWFGRARAYKMPEIEIEVVP